MPATSSWPGTVRLRTDKRTHAVPLIMPTARAEEQDKLAGLEICADDYIGKPFSTRALKAGVKAVLRMRTAQQQMTRWRWRDCGWIGPRIRRKRVSERF